VRAGVRDWTLTTHRRQLVAPLRGEPLGGVIERRSPGVDRACRLRHHRAKLTRFDCCGNPDTPTDLGGDGLGFETVTTQMAE
jgi:hypothetical protein